MSVSLHLGDALDVLPTVESASVDCVITDPPYPEIDRDYGRMSEAEWHAMMDVVVPQCRRILKPSGSAVFILQPNSERVGRMRPWLWEFMAKWTREWGMVQDAWWWNHATVPTIHATHHGLQRSSVKAMVWLGAPDCYRAQEEILWSEADLTTARRNEARAGRIRARKDVTASGHGVHRTTIYDAAERRGGVTPFNLWPVPGCGPYQGGGAFGHGASTPMPLIDRWLRYICPIGGTVCDPFIGSGTVGIAAVKRGCNVIGIEKMPQYHATAERRIAAAEAERAELLIA